MERPILFSGEMVRAILEGRKTQTRRIIKPQPPEELKWLGWCTGTTGNNKNLGSACWVDEFPLATKQHWVKCPYGHPGDRLWVRETFWIEHETDFINEVPTDCGINLKEDTWAKVWYCATTDKPNIYHFYSKRPAIHMPRWASRILLEVVSVKVERLQDITNSDARAEGMETEEYLAWREEAEGCAPPGSHIQSLRDCFQDLWNSINGKKYPWDSNPWVWVIEFRKVD